MRQPTVVYLLAASLLAVSVSTATASPTGDVDALTVKGNVSVVEVVKSSGVYLETYLYVETAAPSTSLLVRCNGNGGGSLTNCLYPGAFLGCTLVHTNYRDIYETSLTTDRYACQAPTRRDSGECVDLSAQVLQLDGFTYTVFSGGHNRLIEALSLDVTDVAYVTGCTSKP